MPTVEPLPPGDLFAFVSRGTEPPQTAVYPWSLRRQLPTIPIPLPPGDAEVSLELQLAFDETYDRAGYRYSVDYTLPIEPSLSVADADGVHSVRQ